MDDMGPLVQLCDILERLQAPIGGLQEATNIYGCWSGKVLDLLVYGRDHDLGGPLRTIRDQ